MPALPKFADWTPPWEKDDDEFDADKAAKLIHGLLSDKEKLTGKVEAANTKLTELTTERDEAVKALDAANASGADEKLVATTKRAEEAERKLQAASADALKYSVALDEGLTKVQAKRLVGNTEDELKADAVELLESFGGAGQKAEEEEEAGQVPTRTPTRLNNPGDRDGDNAVELTDADIQKAVAGFQTGSFI